MVWEDRTSVVHSFHNIWSSSPLQSWRDRKDQTGKVPGLYGVRFVGVRVGRRIIDMQTEEIIPVVQSDMQEICWVM